MKKTAKEGRGVQLLIELNRRHQRPKTLAATTAVYANVRMMDGQKSSSWWP
jgi:hypothetical protein